MMVIEGLLSHPVFTSLRLRAVNAGDGETLRGIAALAQVAYMRGDAVFLNHDETYQRITVPELHGMLRAGTFLVGMEDEPTVLQFVREEGQAELLGGAPALGVCVYVATSSASDITTMSVLSIHPALQRQRLSMRVLAAAFAFAHARGYAQVESDVLACKPWLR